MMDFGDPVEVMLGHHAWAMGKLIEACEKLSQEDFERRFEIGPGSLHDTVTHIVGSVRRYADVLAGRQMRDRLEATRRTAAELRGMHDEIFAEFAGLARQGDLSDMAVLLQGGKRHEITRAGVVTHVALHSMHHRAQCLNMLRRLGVDPLPTSGCMQWMISQ